MNARQFFIVTAQTGYAAKYYGRIGFARYETPEISRGMCGWDYSLSFADGTTDGFMAGEVARYVVQEDS